LAFPKVNLKLEVSLQITSAGFVIDFKLIKAQVLLENDGTIKIGVI
jgi:hypothetical protein